MATAAITKRYTPEEYLALEREANIKSEYKNGFITAMAGTSPKHNTIALNFASEIRAPSRASPAKSTSVTSDSESHQLVSIPTPISWPSAEGHNSRKATSRPFSTRR